MNKIEQRCIKKKYIIISSYFLSHEQLTFVILGEIDWNYSP